MKKSTDVLSNSVERISTAWKVSKYRVFSGPYFSAFGLNTGRYSLRIQSECRKIRTRKTPYLDTFHAAFVNLDRFSPVDHSHLLKKSLTRSFISLRCGYSGFKNLRNIFRIQWNMYHGVFLQKLYLRCPTGF